MGKFEQFNALFILVIIGITIISVISGAISSASEFESQVDTFTTGLNDNTNLSLTQSNGQALTTVTNSTGSTIPATNYTVDFDNDNLLLIDNSTLGSSDSVIVTYTYQQASYLNNSTVRLLLALIPIFLAIILIRKYGGIGK